MSNLYTEPWLGWATPNVQLGSEWKLGDPFLSFHPNEDPTTLFSWTLHDFPMARSLYV